MGVYLQFISMNLKSKLQYRLSFFLTVLGQFLTAYTQFFGLRFLLARAGVVDGFTHGQVLLCFSVVMAAFSLGEMVGGGLAVFPSMLGNGNMDRALVRPRGVILQTIVPNMDFTRLGLLIQAAAVLAYAVPMSGVDWTMGKAALLLGMIACGSALFFSLFLLKATLSFFTVGNLNFMNLFTYGARQFGRYPFSVYGKSALTILTWIVPLALFQYYPLLYLTGRETRVVYALAPLFSLVFPPLCLAFFRYGLKKYKSTGS